MDISQLGASNDTTSNGTSKDSFQDSSQAVDTQNSQGVYWCTEVGGTVLPSTSVGHGFQGGLSAPPLHGHYLLPTTSVSPYRCPTRRSPAVTAARFTSRRIILSGPTPHTASILIRSRASSFASLNSVLTLVNFMCSFRWRSSCPKL